MDAKESGFDNAPPPNIEVGVVCLPEHKMIKRSKTKGKSSNKNSWNNYVSKQPVGYLPARPNKDVGFVSLLSPVEESVEAETV